MTAATSARKIFLYLRKEKFLASYFSHNPGENFRNSKNTLKRFLIFQEMELYSPRKLYWFDYPNNIQVDPSNPNVTWRNNTTDPMKW